MSWSGTSAHPKYRQFVEPHSAVESGERRARCEPVVGSGPPECRRSDPPPFTGARSARKTSRSSLPDARRLPPGQRKSCHLTGAGKVAMNSRDGARLFRATSSRRSIAPMQRDGVDTELPPTTTRAISRSARLVKCRVVVVYSVVRYPRRHDDSVPPTAHRRCAGSPGGFAESSGVASPRQEFIECREHQPVACLPFRQAR